MGCQQSAPKGTEVTAASEAVPPEEAGQDDSSRGQDASQSQAEEPRGPMLSKVPSKLLRSQTWAANLGGVQKKRLLDLIKEGGDWSDVWMQASFDVQLQKLLRDHPYLDEVGSSMPHPLQTWTARCKESNDSRHFGQAQGHLRRLLAGLSAELRPIQEAFKRFDLDGSGHIDPDEFRQMCAYLGWGEEDVNLMDLDRDGRVTLPDFQAFVGHMGGVHQLFEKRRLRITKSRKDVCDYAGLAVGALVRSHFYVRGRKSKGWKEARVVAVGVESGGGGEGQGPSVLGVRLEFGFGPADRWKTRQVVPTHWVLGGVEDASVAAALREVGILDEQQCFWALLLPDSEMHAMRHLTDHQKAALKLSRETATARHEKALATCRERFDQLGFGEPELQAVLGWVQDLAPVIIHLGLDDVGRLLETDEFYRSQSESKAGEEDKALEDAEAGLFGGHYENAKAFERVKYANLNVMNDYRGVTLKAKPGDSYLVLKDVRLRCTFTAGESASRTADDIAVLDKCAHVLAEYSDADLKGLVAVATGAIASEREGGLPTSGAATLTLLRGGSEDCTREWVTFGFPGLEQRSGRYYFEVQLFAGASSPQVGLLSPSFQRMPYVASTQGVGDDAHGWAVDGQNAACWHAGLMRPWNHCWPSEKPDLNVNQAAATPWAGSAFGGSRKARVLSRAVVVGVAVDLDSRRLRFSTDGEWDEDLFGPDDIPQGTALFPGISFKGRAAFMFGPGEFKHAPPESEGGKFLQWPSTPGGVVRIDCPDLGNSQSLSLHKEIQIHGELHLKRNVQRLVANDQYRLKPKTKRSFALIVANAGLCSGMYHRVGAREGKPLYRTPMGAMIYWDPTEGLWKMNSTDSFEGCFGHAPPDERSPDEPPRQGWRLPDEAQGVLDKGAFESAMEEAGVKKDDINRLTAALAGKEGLIYRVRGETNLAKEWQKLKDPPKLKDAPLTAEAAWEAAIKTLQTKILKEESEGIGYPQLAEEGQVVETKHPYDARNYTWTHEVQFKDTLSMSVYFASKSCTVDQRTSLQISAGGLNKNAMGPGTRMEVLAETGKMMGTLAERLDGGASCRVRLDPPEGEAAAEAPKVEPKEAWKPQEGGKVEALKEDGEWHEAKLTGIFGSSDWYSGDQSQNYLVEFLDDPNKMPIKKKAAEIRKPWDHGLGDGPAEDFTVPLAKGENFALCTESPKAAIVKYDNATKVGSEIASFVLDGSSAFSPITIGAMAEAGPAQEQGVAQGWYLDLVGSVLSDSRAKLANLLQGVGGFSLPPKKSQVKGGRLNNKVMHMLLQSAFKDLEEVVKRLNEGLRDMDGVTLLFKSGVQARILPEIHVKYVGSDRVGSEIKQFTTEAAIAEKPKPASPSYSFWGWNPTPVKPKQVRPDGFQKPGPAQAAGVRGDWVVDLGKTVELNPGKEQVLAQEVVLENPNVLLGLADVTLVFKQPNPTKAALFLGSGPPDSEKWKCSELPGDCAEFQFSSDGDGINQPDQRWGFWALVLPQGAPRLSVQTVDGLANKWVEVTSRAIGIDKAPSCERDEWDEQRLRTLCARHGWEFEWMTEDGERRRRANERQGFFVASGQLAGVREAAEARAAVMAPQESSPQEPAG